MISKHSSVIRLACVLLIATCLPGLLAAQQLSTTLDAIFNQHQYDVKHFGPARWIDKGTAYTTVETSTATSGGQDIVKYETATGKRTVLVPAAKLMATPAARPMKIDDYVWSEDSRQLLIFTNTKKVWRVNSRGDYWVLDVASGRLKKLGGDAPESSLMFAKFSPDGKSVGFVRANNIYVQDLASDQIRALTNDGSATLINGTTDWVTEEELSLRDAFRWSPDSQSIAYWQFDTTGVGEYSLINDTKDEYPVVTTYPYPQPGTTNSARQGRRGVGAGWRDEMDGPAGRSAQSLRGSHGVGEEFERVDPGISEPVAEHQSGDAGRCAHGSGADVVRR